MQTLFVVLQVTALSAAGVGVPKEARSAEELDTLLRSCSVAVVDVYGDARHLGRGFCPPCERLSPYIHGLAREYGDRVSFIKLNAWDPQTQQLATRHAPEGVPQLLFFVNGQQRAGGQDWCGMRPDYPQAISTQIEELEKRKFRWEELTDGKWTALPHWEELERQYVAGKRLLQVEGWCTNESCFLGTYAIRMRGQAGVRQKLEENGRFGSPEAAVRRWQEPRVGDSVSITGLRQKQEYNGLLGTITKYNPANQRFDVTLWEWSETKALKAENIEDPSTADATRQLTAPTPTSRSTTSVAEASSTPARAEPACTGSFCPVEVPVQERSPVRSHQRQRSWVPTELTQDSTPVTEEPSEALSEDISRLNLAGEGDALPMPPAPTVIALDAAGRPTTPYVNAYDQASAGYSVGAKYDPHSRE